MTDRLMIVVSDDVAKKIYEEANRRFGIGKERRHGISLVVEEILRKHYGMTE